MCRRRQAPGAWDESRPRIVDTRSLRASGWLDKPAALRSLDVCLDSKGPFIDVSAATRDRGKTTRERSERRRRGFATDVPRSSLSTRLFTVARIRTSRRRPSAAHARTSRFSAASNRSAATATPPLLGLQRGVARLVAKQVTVDSRRSATLTGSVCPTPIVRAPPQIRRSCS